MFRTFICFLGIWQSSIFVDGTAVEITNRYGTVTRSSGHRMEKPLMRSEKADAKVLPHDSVVQSLAESGAIASIAFNVVGARSFCGYQYVSHGAQSLNACATSCALRAGCTTFSYGAHDFGCRLSACGDINLPDSAKTEVCGKCTDTPSSPVVAHQCASETGTGNALYLISNYVQMGVSLACTSGTSVSKSGATNPLACAKECSAQAGCNYFSFGDDFGCRTSSSATPCSTETKQGNYVYKHPFAITSGSMASSFNVLAESRCCGYQFKHVSTTSDLNGCASDCANQFGCTVFSFGSYLGCRISACGYDDALDKRTVCDYDDTSKPFGVSNDDHGAAVMGQCGTHPYSGETMYVITSYAQIGVGMACGYNYLTSSAATPLACAHACASYTHAGTSSCTVFSFGELLGCRYSASCSDAQRGDKSKACGYAGAGAIAVEGQCGTHTYSKNFLYRLPTNFTYSYT